MVFILVIIAAIAGIAGFFCLSQATMGVGVICLGCLAAILARVFQADEHHRAIACASSANDVKEAA